MSIAVGFSDWEWTVICADRQMTVADAGLKFEGSKLCWREFTAGESPGLSGQRKPYKVAFAYCGIPERAQMLLQDVSNALEDAVIEADECYVYESEFFRQALLPVYKSKDAKDLQTLVGLETTGRCFLFMTKGEQVVTGQHEYIGGGDSSVLRYFAHVTRSASFTSEEATSLGIYLVHLASRYVDGCGLGIDVAILERDKPLRVLGKEDVDKYLRRFTEFERQMGKEFFAEP